MTNAYEELIASIKETSLLRTTMSVLGWDQRTKMPQGGVGLRSEQLALLARLVHERSTAPRVGELLATCEADDSLTSDPHSDTAANLREIRRSYDRAT